MMKHLIQFLLFSILLSPIACDTVELTCFEEDIHFQTLFASDFDGQNEVQLCSDIQNHNGFHFNDDSPFVVCIDRDKSYVSDLTGNTIADLLPLFEQSRAGDRLAWRESILSVTRDGQAVYYSNNYRLFRANLNAGTVDQLYGPGSAFPDSLRGHRLSRDYSRIYWTQRRADRFMDLGWIDLNSGEVNSVRLGPEVGAVDWSPDETRVIYTTKTGLWETDLRSSQNTLLLGEIDRLLPRDPKFSPDGSKIFFTTWDGRQTAFHVFAEGQSEEMLSGTGMWRPTWRGNDHIRYLSPRSENGLVEIVDLDVNRKIKKSVRNDSISLNQLTIQSRSGKVLFNRSDFFTGQSCSGY